MSFSALVQQYIRPTRWWRRKRTIQLTVWPRFLAQWLCPHISKRTVSWDVEQKTKTCLCLDCHKWLLEANLCGHGEVRIHGLETTNIGLGRRSAQLSVRTYICEHCGVEIEKKDLPTGAKITNANNESLWRD